jgi:Tfp pilus assembly protein PilF
VRLGFLQCLFAFFLVADPETLTIGSETFSKNLNIKDEIALATPGSFYLNPQDFVLTAGPNFQGPPPASRASFEYEGQKISNLGKFNNRAIEILLKGEKDSFSKAEAMLEASVYADPLFFPTRYNFARILQLTGKWGESKDQFLKARAILPSYYRIYLHLGLLEYKQSRHLEASEYLRKAVSLEKFRKDSKALLCIMAFRTGYPASYKRFLKENYPNPSNLSQKTCAAAKWNAEKKYQKTGKLQKEIAKEDYEKEPHYPRFLHLLLSEAAEEVGDLKGMEEHFRKLTETPYDWVYLFIEHGTVYRKLEQIDYLQKSRQEKP